MHSLIAKCNKNAEQPIPLESILWYHNYFPENTSINANSLMDQRKEFSSAYLKVLFNENIILR